MTPDLYWCQGGTTLVPSASFFLSCEDLLDPSVPILPQDFHLSRQIAQ